ncbi:hypothetical protein AVEN_21701-1 [Araneus ventricosus]|uniref:Uncharacterized protein n=1 Tax=Araneus ventricosus TaxID=182803 RepID=A0A4Y2TL79_ARAVE|nr:hypothetical protein AVEN_21701-1 [Araneus ventricosus]
MFCPLNAQANVTKDVGGDNIPWDREVEDNMKLEFLKWFEECSPKNLSSILAVFVCIEYVDVVHANLLAAKLRVAPVKSITFPHLELLSATLGARLCRSVLSALQRDNVKQHYWTDSTTVLGWIQREELWSVFVNNRVQEIRKLTDPTLWKHLPGAQSPAD